MFASSGEMTAPCGVPSSDARHSPFLRRPGCEPLSYEPDYPPVADSVFYEPDQPFVAHPVKELTDVGIQYPVYVGRTSPVASASSASCWLRPGLNPYENPIKSFS